MFPIDVVALAGGKQVLVDLKSGETYIGTLAHLDQYMNVRMKDVLRTSKDGKQFWEITEVYILGISIQNMRLPDSVYKDAVKVVQYRENLQQPQQQQQVQQQYMRTFSRPQQIRRKSVGMQ